jgi:hypothetical protein
MDLTKYPIDKLLFVVAAVIPGFSALLIYAGAKPRCFDWFFSLHSLGYQTKVLIVLTTALLVGATITRFVSGFAGAVGGAIGGVVSKPAHMYEVAPWRNETWRAALSKVLQGPPKNTLLWSKWLHEQKVQAINLLPESERPLATTQMQLEELANHAEDAEWYRWYRHYHNVILFPT